MKDFVKKYQKRRIIGNIGIVLWSLAMAFGINFFLIDDTNFGKSLKTSVLDSEITNNRPDIMIKKDNNSLVFSNGKAFQNTEIISLTITYDPTSIANISATSTLGNVDLFWWEESGIQKIIINTQSTSIKANTEFLRLDIKKQGASMTQVNLIETSFRDSSGKTFSLSSWGVTF